MVGLHIEFNDHLGQFVQRQCRRVDSATCRNQLQVRLPDARRRRGKAIGVGAEPVAPGGRVGSGPGGACVLSPGGVGVVG